MKSLWRTAWSLERRSAALIPVVSLAPIPATRQGRHVKARSSFSGPEPTGSRGSHFFEIRQSLRNSLESQAEIDAASEGRSIASKSRSGHRGDTRYGLFKRLVLANFEYMLRGQRGFDLRALGIKNRDELVKEAHLFRNIIEKAFDLASRSGVTGRQRNPYFWIWRNAFVSGDSKLLLRELKHSFISFRVRQHLSKDVIACHERLADFRFPHEWFPATRTMQRTIHLHVGPTNSGKTYNALKALENSKTGIYAGPLRLLAHEIYTRFQAKGKRCALVTGEDQRIPEGDESYFASCTVEMTPLNQRVDVAVIDEIQMIGDETRGWAWTQALLGVQAKEVHVCGEERAVPLIQALCSKVGDEVVVHRYKRLSSLQPMKESLDGNLSNLQKGDAVISFSRVNLHSLKAGIEQTTGKKCAIVYGALPPESRAQQAALFNDPNNDYDYLAASDAIGMGLNLEIRRVIFEAVNKHDGMQVRPLTTPELKQIGGRAGRYRTAAQAVRASAVTPTAQPPKPATTAPKTGQGGFVTCLEKEDLEAVQSSFSQEAEPLKTAGLSPPAFVIERFASYFPADTPFSSILLRLRDIARLQNRYHICDLEATIQIANTIQGFPLSVQDRCIFLTAPVSLRDAGMAQILQAMAQRVALNMDGNLLSMKEINLEVLDYTRETYPHGPAEYLKHMEGLHKSLTLYLWLSYRYVGVFQSQGLAFHVKAMVEERINEYLESLDYSPEARQQRIRLMRKQANERRRKAEKVFGDEAEKDKPRGVWTLEGHEEPMLNGLGEAEEVPPAHGTNP